MKMNETTRRWLISTGVTFATGFCLVLVAEIDNITLESFRDGSIVGIAFTAVRSGIKASIEAFLAWRGVK